MALVKGFLENFSERPANKSQPLKRKKTQNFLKFCGLKKRYSKADRRRWKSSTITAIV